MAYLRSCASELCQLQQRREKQKSRKSSSRREREERKKKKENENQNTKKTKELPKNNEGRPPKTAKWPATAFNYVKGG